MAKSYMIVSFIFGFYMLNLSLGVEGHILVYRRLTNQLIEEYNDMPAQFGPSLPTNGIKVFAMPVVPNEEACGNISSPPSSLYPKYAKFAAIIRRGGPNCTFELKVRSAQAAGFNAVIVYNNESDDLAYHSVCIDVWLTETKRECPICKRRVFSKGETQSQRNRQSSLDSVTDTDDDTTPLLQHQQQPSTNSSINSSVMTHNSTLPSITSHGTFRRSGGHNIEASPGGDVTSDDENMLSPARRVNPFDRSPNLPPHLAAQLNNETRIRSFWSWPVLRWFSRPTVISVAAPPYLEDNFLQDVLAEQSSLAVAATEHVVTAAPRASHSSNNVLNPNLSGSFKDDEEDDAPLQCIYEPITTQTATAAGTTVSNALSTSVAASAIKSAGLPQPIPGAEANSINETDSDFFQTPTQGGIAVAALPPNNNINNNTNANSIRFW